MNIIKFIPQIKKWLGLLLIITFIITQTGCKTNVEKKNTGIAKTGFYLDTVCTITIYGIEDKSGDFSQMSKDEQEKEIYLLITDAFKLCTDFEKKLSKTIEGSDIYRVNQSKGQATKVEDVTIEVLKKGIEYGQLSQGAFDITIGQASKLWNFRDKENESQAEKSKVPDAGLLMQAMKHVDYKKIKIKGNEVTLMDPEMELDLGGIAKGYIADRVAEYLEEQGVISAVVDLGGNIVTIGGKMNNFTDPREGEIPFVIGIKDPTSERGGVLGTVQATDKTVVTSGTYERYFEEKGIKYHHILSTTTGYPVATDVLSVTIIAEKGHSVDCDGLSTTCLALGMEAGTEFIQGIDGVEAIFVSVDGEIKTVANEQSTFQLSR